MFNTKKEKNNSGKVTNICILVLSYSLFLLTSCSNSVDFFNFTIREESKSPALERPTNIALEHHPGEKILDLNLTYAPIIDGSAPSSVTVTGMKPGSTLSLHRESCDTSVDDTISSDGSLTPSVGTVYSEVNLYLKYTTSQKSECIVLDSKYIYIEPPTGTIDAVQTKQHPSTPTVNVTNLFSGKDVEVALYTNDTCSSDPVSSTVHSSTGSTLLTLSEGVSYGSHDYWIKQSYKGISSCSSQVVYTYKKPIEFQAFLHEPRGFPTNQNRGIIVKNTTAGNKLKVYTGTSCTDQEHLVTTVRTNKGTTDIETRSLADGSYKFSFLELDSHDNELECYTTPTVTMRTRRFVGMQDFYVEVDSTKQNIRVMTHYDDDNFDVPVKVKNLYANINKGAAVLFEDGSVIALGDPSAGGDSTDVEEDLDGTIPVVAIYTNKYAFAALRSDGSVITWGNSYNGGVSSSVEDDIDGTIPVVNIYSTDIAFAALRSDGSVVIWGSLYGGGDSTGVEEELDGTIPVVNMYATERAFTALRSDGSVISWGSNYFGGDSSGVEEELDGTIPVIHMYAAERAFTALRSDGSVISWGEEYVGWNGSTVASLLNGTNPVIDIYPIGVGVFAALRSDGSVILYWSKTDYLEYIDETNSIIDLAISNYGDIAALRSDGSVIMWGNDYDIEEDLDGTIPVVKVYSTDGAIAALRSDGSVITWGDEWYGGDSSAVENDLDGTIPVVKIYSTESAFAALRSDGSVVAWGEDFTGGDSTIGELLDGTTDVVNVTTHRTGFSAELTNGELVNWYIDVSGGSEGGPH